MTLIWVMTRVWFLICLEGLHDLKALSILEKCRCSWRLKVKIYVSKSSYYVVTVFMLVNLDKLVWYPCKTSLYIKITMQEEFIWILASENHKLSIIHTTTQTATFLDDILVGCMVVRHKLDICWSLHLCHDYWIVILLNVVSMHLGGTLDYFSSY